MSIGKFPEDLIQAILVGTILEGRLGVQDDAAAHDVTTSTAIFVVEPFAFKMLGSRIAHKHIDFRTLCARISQRPHNQVKIVPDSRLEGTGCLMRKTAVS